MRCHQNRQYSISFECVYGTIESSISILGFYIHHLDLSSVVSLSYDMGDDSMQAEAE
jgi:hypothetical protein